MNFGVRGKEKINYLSTEGTLNYKKEPLWNAFLSEANFRKLLWNKLVKNTLVHGRIVDMLRDWRKESMRFEERHFMRLTVEWWWVY